MSENDRLTGLVGPAAIKVPCAAASTVALTLSGEQTIDGVACVTGDRILVKNQASSVDNGIYVCDTGTWERSKDADGSYDLVYGTLVKVNGGTVGAGFWYVTTTTNPIVVDSTAITWGQASTVLAVVTAYAQGLLASVDASAAQTVLGMSTYFKTLLSAASAAATRLLLGFSAIAAKGDLFVGTAANTIGTLTAGANGAIPMARSAASVGLAYVAALNKAIYGLTYDVGTDTVNDCNINVGGAMDATGAYWMTLATALGKQSDVNWAVGGTTGIPAGWLDTGAVGNSDYYIWLIARSDTGVVDSLCSLSSTAPTMPGAGAYDFKRLIGWFKRVGGTIVAFKTYETEGGGLEMNWDSPTLDVNLANTLTTARRTDAVKVPLNFSVSAALNVEIFDAATAALVWIYCPDQTDLAPNPTAAPLATLQAQAAGTRYFAQIQIRTSSAGLIAARADLATVDLYGVVTLGFRWARRN